MAASLSLLACRTLSRTPCSYHHHHQFPKHLHFSSASLSSSPYYPPNPSLSFSSSPIPAAWFSCELGFRRNRERIAVVARGGLSTNTYIFAFVFPLSLLLGTIITAMKIGDDLDRKFLEEFAINEAIRRAEEEEEDEEEDDDDGLVVTDKEEESEPEPAAATTQRTRNRPKRQV